MSEPTTIELDFSDVQEFDGPLARNVPKGDYLLRVKDIEKSTSKSSGNPMWIVTSTFEDGPARGQIIKEYLALTESALFKVKSWLDAIHGQKLPKQKIKLPNTTEALRKKFVGKVYGAHVDDGDPYTNNQGSTVTKSEIVYHIFPQHVKDNQQAAKEAEAVTASSPAEEPDTASEESTGDVAEQLESFDLDEL